MLADSGTAVDVHHLMVQFVLQLAVIVLAARVGGSFVYRVLRLPRVIGELASGMVIGPYALGGLALPGGWSLFPPLEGAALPFSPELYALATLASILLLFMAGLETDIRLFFNYAVAGTLIGFCGVFFSFVLGALCAVWFGVAESFLDPGALFLGTISTATSVGLTARILTERRQNASPEGATIMAAAVFDDVLGLIVLAVVVGMAQMGDQGGGELARQVLWVGLKAFGFWIGCMLFTMLTAKKVSGLLKLSKTPSTIASLSLGLALLLAGISEMAGLAMIIGAYIAGLALSRTDLAHFLQEQFQGLQMFLVPVFFCVMGMLVDFRAMTGAVTFGIIFTVVAIIAKVAGCALPAYLTRFNMKGSLRIGLGMLPRGEVALIVAGIGYSSGMLTPDLMGVAIMMTMITTLMAPPLLARSFKGGRGARLSEERGEDTDMRPLTLKFPSADIATFLRNRLVRAFRDEEFFVSRFHGAENPTFMIRKEDVNFVLVQRGEEVDVLSTSDYQHIARFMVLEELLALGDLKDALTGMENLGDLESSLVADAFGDTD